MLIIELNFDRNRVEKSRFWRSRNISKDVLMLAEQERQNLFLSIGELKAH